MIINITYVDGPTLVNSDYSYVRHHNDAYNFGIDLYLVYRPNNFVDCDYSRSDGLIWSTIP